MSIHQISERVTLAEFASDPTRVFRHVVDDDVTVLVESEDGTQAELRPVRAESDMDRVKRLPPPTAEQVERARAGIRKAAGGWTGIVDADAFKAYVRERRRTANRPSIRL